MISEDQERSGGYSRLLLAAKSYCSYLENMPEVSESELLGGFQKHLLWIYNEAQEVRQVSLEHDVDFEDTVTPADLAKVMDSLASVVRLRFYWHVFDPSYQTKSEAVCGDLIDDLGDIYRDLKNSLTLYDQGSPQEIESALWNLKNSFDSHWGDHCVNAQYALHYILKSII